MSKNVHMWKFGTGIRQQTIAFQPFSASSSNLPRKHEPWQRLANRYIKIFSILYGIPLLFFNIIPTNVTLERCKAIDQSVLQNHVIDQCFLMDNLSNFVSIREISNLQVSGHRANMVYRDVAKTQCILSLAFCTRWDAAFDATCADIGG